jgi:hypothetical protein
MRFFGGGADYASGDLGVTTIPFETSGPRVEIRFTGSVTGQKS